jgi:hypothetical protein
MLDYAKQLGSGSNLEQTGKKPSLLICGTCWEALVVAQCGASSALARGYCREDGPTLLATVLWLLFAGGAVQSGWIRVYSVLHREHSIKWLGFALAIIS